MSGELWGLLIAIIFMALVIAANLISDDRNDKVKIKLRQLQQMIDSQKDFKASHCLIKFPRNQPTWIPNPIGIAQSMINQDRFV